MHDIFAHLNLALVLQLFVLINPLYSLPYLMAAQRHNINVRRVAVSAVITAFIIAVIIALFGPFMFNLFGITLNSLRIAGGIVILLLGLETIRSGVESKSNVNHIDTMIAIIASPMLTGPATISFVTIKTYEIGRASMLVNLFAAFILVAVVFIAFSFVIERINQRLISITARVLGLFLTAVAIEMMARGVQAYIAGT
ncbi:MAG: MarC family protein [bacterium]|nr:MarC family protein [bacterium]